MEPKCFIFKTKKLKYQWLVAKVAKMIGPTGRIVQSHAAMDTRQEPGIATVVSSIATNIILSS